MKSYWQRGKLGLAGLSAAAIAAAAVPDEAQPPRGSLRAIDHARPRPTVTTPMAHTVQLDIERLRRLRPARAEEPVQSPEATSGQADVNSMVEQAPPGAGVVDAFATRTWYVPPPPPPPVVAAPPPKPTAPPLPFAYMGSYDDAEGPTVIMLVRSDRLYTVSEGDLIDGTYRIERVQGGVIEMTYLPLQEKQQLATGNP
ncbi:MAG: hypothetical protein HZC22_17400 [Rhodocyclales bacterium]|nr:hypothetical protein [Rhodocyclales bacterium]